METRELFVGLSALYRAVFYTIGWFAIAISLAGIARHVAKYRRARPLLVSVDLWQGLKRLLVGLGTHRVVTRRDRYAGIAHAGVFFGFALLFLGTTTITVDYDIVRPLFHRSFWKGEFFLVFSLLLDLAGLAAVVGLIALMARRASFHLPKLRYLRTYRGETDLRPVARAWRIEDWVFMGALLFILLGGFVQEGLRHALENPPWRPWEPVGELVSGALRLVAPNRSSLYTARLVNWWVHGLAALIFIAALPWYKAKHMLAAFGSMLARDPLTLARLPKISPQETSVGIGTIAEFSWKDMLDFDACTKCGRCHEACPAQASGYLLSPRDLILDLRTHNDTVQGRTAPGISLIGGVIGPETLWACRSCGACQEICPVGVEHPVKIIQMRRKLIERRQMDPLLEQVLTAIGNTGNSFGENSRKRSAWTRDLPFRVKDIRKESAENLWFVGDYASFDPRNQRVSRTFAGLLRIGRVDFGLLHEGEKTAGNDVRRVGEEGLYESLVEHNLGQLSAARPFMTIITTDPHSFNTIRNEYPEFGKVAPIRHYTDVLRELLEGGRLRVVKPLNLKVTFHDPCHLGRLNKRYDDPRRVLELIGCEIVEMPRNRANSFCCGAGGGRIWMADPPGTKKPSELRVQEAADLGVIDVFVTCCPKDLTMFEDARKTAGLEHAFVVEDIAELVARAVDLETLRLHDVPELVRTISEAVAEKVASRIDVRLRELMDSAVDHVARLPSPVASPAVAASASLSAIAPLREAGATEWIANPVRPAQFPQYAVPDKTGKRLLVAVKHVTKLGDGFQISPDGKHVPSEFHEYQLNEFDDVALEQALQTAEKLGGAEIVVVTIGPPDADDTLRKALAKGADRGVRVWNDTLRDADPISIARMLAGIAAKEQPDLVFCGVQSSDQANGATGSALAQLLGMASAAVVVATDWDGTNSMRVTRELEGGLRHEFRLPVPAVLTIQTGASTPRYATMRMIKQAKAKPVVDVDAAFGGESPYLGVAVDRMDIPKTGTATMWTGTPEEVAGQILRLISQKTGLEI